MASNQVGGAGASAATDVRSRSGGEQRPTVVHTPPKIWVAVTFIILGFLLGGLAIPLHSLSLLVVGIAVLLVSSIVAWAFGIMNNVH